MNKRENKFKIVTEEELESSLTDNIEIVSAPEEVSVGESDYEVKADVDYDVEESNEVVETPLEEPKEEYDISDKKHIGFGTRIFIMLLFIFISFGVACFLIIKTIDYSNNEKVSYVENAKVNYKVCLDKEDKCLDEGASYKSSDIKNINTTFDYSIDFNKNVPYELTYHITAITKIYDKKDPSKILHKEEVLLVDRTTLNDDRNSFNIYKDVTYDYDKDNQYVVSYKDIYKNEYIADVKIVLYLDEEEESREVASITALLNSNSFEIDKSNTLNSNSELVIKDNSWNSYTIIFAIMASLLIIISLLLLLRMTRLILKVTNNRTKYQQKLMQIFRDYDRIIVIARDGYETNKDREVVKLEDFDKLLDVKDNLNKPIIFSKISDVKCEFIVEDDEKLYKYVLKDEDV